MSNPLWNKYSAEEYSTPVNMLYHEHIMEQYKLYVEMADRISARRSLANLFFLSLHTTFFGAIGFTFQHITLIDPKWLICIPLLPILLLCVVWWWLLLSYRQLNSAKYKVIGELEKKLPASPYWAAEWNELGKGKDLKRYLPLTAIEIYVPIIFFSLYSILGVYVFFFIK